MARAMNLSTVRTQKMMTLKRHPIPLIMTAALLSLAALSTSVNAEDIAPTSSATADAPMTELPPPANLENSKSDILQLDRDLANYEQRFLTPLRTTLLFGLSPNSTLGLRNLQVQLDGKLLVNRDYGSPELASLQKGGMDLLFDTNLPLGRHVLSVTVQPLRGPQVQRQLAFIKKNPVSLMAIQWVEKPAPGTFPLRLVEWVRHD